MESKVTNKGNHEKVVEVEVPESELTPYFDSAFQKYRKNLKIEGFRKGKVPMALIKKMYGDAIKSEAIDDVVQDVFREVREKEDLKPVAPAKLEDVQYDPEKGLHFKAVVEVVPEFELKKYHKLSVEHEVYQVDDADVEEALEDVREQMAVMEPVEGEAIAEHFVLADLQQVDPSGVPIIGRKYEDRLIHLSEEDNEVTDQLVGVKAGESRRLELRRNGESGQEPETEIFEVKVKEVKSKHVPELDDELAKDAGDFENLDELKEDIRKRLIKRSRDSAREQLRHRLIDAVLKENSFELPKSMVDGYLDVLVENAKRQHQGQVEEETLRQQYRPSAIWNLKWELVKDKIKDLENIEVTDEDIENYMKEIAEEQGMELDEVKKNLKSVSENRLREDILDRKIVAFLESHAKIKEKKVTRKDLEKARAKQSKT